MSWEQQERLVYPVSLGCAKNRVDLEIMLALLEAEGWRVTREPTAAVLLLVNTCGFLTSACQEAVDVILELAAHKEADPGKKLVVTGCLVQRYQEQLPPLLPEVDLFLGVNDFPRLPQLLKQGEAAPPGLLSCRDPWRRYQRVWPRRLTTPFYSAYLKIAEGCSHHCTFCLIPRLRGPYRSRPLATLLSEAQALARQGVVELNLVAQDTMAYGLDLAGRPLLPELLTALARIPELKWLRVLYGHPERLTPELLAAMADESKVCPYFDLPIQHVNNRLLQRMGRRYGQDDLRRLVREIRTAIPGAAIRSSVILGFPGESAADFAELCQVLEELAFDHLGIFAYQPEEGTPAASYPDQVAAREANRRARRVRQQQQRLARRRWRAWRGTVQEVLIEGPSEESELLLQGRLKVQAPEVDGRVLITAGYGEVGRIQPVRLTRVLTYDLVGEILEEMPLPTPVSPPP